MRQCFKSTGLFIPLFLCSLFTFSQAPVIQWQKCYGGTNSEGFWSITATSDGGYLVAGTSNSNDGDITINKGQSDVWILKIDANGNIQWQQSFGGTGVDLARDAEQTADGGYIIAATTQSINFDVTGNHGGKDIWIIKLSSTGALEWQHCYGGTGDEQEPCINITNDGGFIVSAESNSNNGDVAGGHGNYDAWVFKIDASGGLLWQKCLGGNGVENHANIVQSPDGGYLLTTSSTSSQSGQVNCATTNGDLWIVKLDNSGSIEWRKCWGGNGPEINQSVLLQPGGGYLLSGQTFSSDLPGFNQLSGGYVLRIDPSGNIVKLVIYGGSSFDDFLDAKLTPDGGMIIGGSSESTDGDLCKNNGINDYWIVKLDAQLEIEWHKTMGGKFPDYSPAIEITPDGGYILAGHTTSNDGDVSGNHSNQLDGWLVKLGFPGIIISPTINIMASETTICPGKKVRFVASVTDGGTDPVFQWMINGINTGINNDTILLSSLNDGDVISCHLRSNSPCVTNRNALSNNISIHVDASLTPSSFLPPDIMMCKYGTFEILPNGTYNSYLWNNNATSPSLIVDDAGRYWLQVVTPEGCPGSDTIIVALKECLKGFYMPTGFTPNGDGRNDVLRPIIEGRILQYKLAIINRWGQTVFTTRDPLAGWDGRYKGAVQNNDVFIWTCTYQLAGEMEKSEKGTFMIIR